MNFKNDKGHIVITIDGLNYIVDTGSPHSFSFYRSGSISIDGRTVSLQCNKNRMTMDAASRMVSSKIEGFIGVDFLKQGFTVDYNSSVIEFIPKKGKVLFNTDPASAFLVTRDATINGHKINRLVIDSGAWVSYVSEKVSRILNPTGNRILDYGMFGRIDTDEYEATLGSINDGSYQVFFKAGILPSVYGSAYDAVVALSLISPTGVVSYDGKSFMEIE